MEQDVKGESRVCRTPPGPLKIGLSTHTDRREAIVAASLITILSITVLSTYILWLPPQSAPPSSHGFIEIDGDANFAATALLEGWPGDGSPENPFIIDGLDINLGGNLISISNTQASFTISNCNLTGECYNTTRYIGAGIYLENVTNGELVNNICNRHSHGIILYGSSSNTVFNNTCTDNIDGGGITLDNSDSNTVANNTCSNYGGIYLFESDHNLVENNTVSGTWVGISLGHSDYNTISYNNCSSIMCGVATGIFLGESDSNTVSNNICNYNANGISLESSDSNTVSNNICNHNECDGISLYDSGSNTVVNNTCTSNDIGISLESSNLNTVENNICNNNRIGIYLIDSPQNTVASNICLNNTEHDILEESSESLCFCSPVGREKTSTDYTECTVLCRVAKEGN